VPASQSAVRRLCLAVDVESYSKRAMPEQLDVQTRLLWTMVQACRTAHVALAACERQDSGDGQILLLPAGIDESTVLPGLVLGLLAALHNVNHPVGEGGRIRLRVSLGQGAVQVGATGFVAPSVVTVCRLLDSDELRAALSASPDSDAAFIVTADLFQDMFAQGYGGLPARDFRPVRISRPSKGFSADAWIQVPGPRDDLPRAPGFPGATAAELRRKQLSRSGTLAVGGAATAALAWAVFSVSHDPLDHHLGGSHQAGRHSPADPTTDHPSADRLADHSLAGHSLAEQDDHSVYGEHSWHEVSSWHEGADETAGYDNDADITQSDYDGY
jgi:hypothetical protein